MWKRFRALNEPFSALDVLTADALRTEIIDIFHSGKTTTRSLLMVSRIHTFITESIMPDVPKSEAVARAPVKESALQILPDVQISEMIGLLESIHYEDRTHRPSERIFAGLSIWSRRRNFSISSILPGRQSY
jgi:hypothetical protein